ncbi:hypothetical protein EYD10_12243 [Varanus komodoensis]|nr:hypothetical protein EYD10_12243 [Varanus komodoensis]
MMTCPTNEMEQSTCGEQHDQQQGPGAACHEDGENLWDPFGLLQIDTGCASSRSQFAGNENENWCSRNALRKQRHWEKIIAAKKNKRKCERERRKAKHAEEKGAAPQLSKRDLKMVVKQRLLEAKETGPWLCIDLSMTGHMTKKEIGRLAAQIRRLYGSNKKAQNPFWIYLTGFVKNSPIYDACLRMNDGFASYLEIAEKLNEFFSSVFTAEDTGQIARSEVMFSRREPEELRQIVMTEDEIIDLMDNLKVEGYSGQQMDVTPESYLDLFPLKTIVYLTPDSENALEEVDPQKVHILGGLVDESIQKRLTFQIAREKQVQTARLPIQEYMVKNVNAKNYHSTTLAINQVFDALLTFYETKSWEEALKAAVSPGKGYVLRGTTS